jgi:signal transduction histidine kinase
VDRPGSLELCIRDDGARIPEGVPAGVGLLSLRERAEELGGQCTVSCPADGGTVVRASLPCGPGEALDTGDPVQLASARGGSA